MKVPNPPPPVSSRRKLPTRRHLPSLPSSTATTSQPAASSSAVSAEEAADQEHLSVSQSVTSQPPTSPTAVRAEEAAQHERSSQTPRKVLLRKKIRHLQCQRWKMTRRLQCAKSAMLAKSESRPVNTVSEVIEASKPYLSALQFAFFRSQLTATLTTPKGHRWSVKEKLFFLQLYYKSPAAYRFMSQNFVLPSASTLSKFVRNAVGRLDSGFSDVMMAMLKLRLTDLSMCDRQCALVFDEMALKCHLAYDKHQDRIVGYTEDTKLATHALVFMVRGLHAKWKQAFAFFFTHNTIATSRLAELIPLCVCKLTSIGLCVRCLVCDQGATNVAAVKQLGFSLESTFLEFDGVPNKVYVVFDVPHILKNVRNNLQRHDIQVDDGTARWTHIQQFYHADKMSPIRLAPKLTDRHIDVTSTEKMRVSLAAQVFSHSVAAGIKMRVMTNELPSEATFTADFLENMDKLFDLLNSRVMKSDRPARYAVTAVNSNLGDLLALKTWVEKWIFVGARAQSGILCHWGLQTSILNIHAMCQELLQEGFKFVCTARFNQDCLENFFAGLRSKQGWNENPTPFQFTSAFRNAVLLSSLDSTCSGKSCIADEDFMLIQHSTMVQSQDVELQPSSSTSYSATATFIAEDSVWEEISNEILNSDVYYEQGVLEVFTEAEESLISYLSGWLARKCGICIDCQDVLTKRLGEHSYCRRATDDFSSVKRFAASASVGLVAPCEELVAAVHKMEESFRLHYSVMCPLPRVAMCLYDVIHPQCNFNFLFMRHPEHASYLAQKLTKMYIVMRIFYAVKFENRTLKKPQTSHSHGESSRRTTTKRKMQKVLHL